VTPSHFTFLWCLEKGKENKVEENVEEREERKNLPRVALLAQVFASYLYKRLGLLTAPVAPHPQHLNFFILTRENRGVWAVRR